MTQKRQKAKKGKRVAQKRQDRQANKAQRKKKGRKIAKNATTTATKREGAGWVQESHRRKNREGKLPNDQKAGLPQVMARVPSISPWAGHRKSKKAKTTAYNTTRIQKSSSVSTTIVQKVLQRVPQLSASKETTKSTSGKRTYQELAKPASGKFFYF